MSVKPAIINVMEGAARKAARGLIRDFGEVEQLQVSRKGPADFVSAADTRAERIIREELTKARPDFGLMMEEAGETKNGDADNRWIVDPLDGTTNFLHGIPHFAISIAHQQGKDIVAAVIHEPIRDEMFWAVRGGGAFLNDRRLLVSARARLTDSLIATGLPFRGKEKHPRYLDTVAAIMPKVAGIRRFGAAALDLAWVAAGRYDGFWEYGLSPWDMAAGILLVREAGGMVTTPDLRDIMLASGDILASNTLLHDDLAGEIRKALRAS